MSSPLVVGVGVSSNHKRLLLVFRGFHVVSERHIVPLIARLG